MIEPTDMDEKLENAMRSFYIQMVRLKEKYDMEKYIQYGDLQSRK